MSFKLSTLSLCIGGGGSVCAVVLADSVLVWGSWRGLYPSRYPSRYPREVKENSASRKKSSNAGVGQHWHKDNNKTKGLFTFGSPVQINQTMDINKTINPGSDSVARLTTD